MTKLNYLTHIDAKRNHGLEDIKNGTVNHFYKATVCNAEYYADVQCEITRELLIEDFEEEIQERKDRGNKFLTKIFLTTATPENADYVSVNTGLCNRIIDINEIVEVRENQNQSIEMLEAHRETCYSKANRYSKSNTSNKHKTVKWVY